MRAAVAVMGVALFALFVMVFVLDARVNKLETKVESYETARERADDASFKRELELVDEITSLKLRVGVLDKR